MEEADFRAAQELFGGQDLDKMQPKSAKDFEDYAAALVHKYVAAHSRSSHYKTLVKALLKVGSMHRVHTYGAVFADLSLTQGAAAALARKMCGCPQHQSS